MNVADPAHGSHGQSRIVNPTGSVVAEATEAGEAVVAHDLNLTLSTGAYAQEELLAGRFLQRWWSGGKEEYVTVH